MTPQTTHHVQAGARLSTRVHEVAALLALAPRSETALWIGEDLRQWVAMTRTVEPVEIRSALSQATQCGAGPTDVVPAAAHIVLARLARRVHGNDAARVRRNIDSVCSHLHDHVGPAVAGRLPRLEPEPEPEPRSVSGAAVWAYFFACLAFLLLVVVLTN